LPNDRDSPVGTSRARELMFLSERIDARRWEALGLINRVVPVAELRDTAFALAMSLALAVGPSIALAYKKDNLDHAVTSNLLDSMDQEAEDMVRAARDRSQGSSACLRRQRKSAFSVH
jgi:enoyl-CoA hydratase/carnithine racemase